MFSNELKQEYDKKIIKLEIEKQELERQQQQCQIDSNERAKYKNKIQELEKSLFEFKTKGSNLNHLQKKIDE